MLNTVILSGLEPETYCLEGSCSIQLSYRTWINLSGWQDSNLRPPRPKRGAIPGYATPRTLLNFQKNTFAFLCNAAGASRIRLALLRLLGINFSPFGAVPNFGDPAGARTQDPNIKSVMLYQLSYGICYVLTCFFSNHYRNWTANLSY
jgi:hypothetical protein